MFFDPNTPHANSILRIVSFSNAAFAKVEFKIIFRSVQIGRPRIPTMRVRITGTDATWISVHSGKQPVFRLQNGTIAKETACNTCCVLNESDCYWFQDLSGKILHNHFSIPQSTNRFVSLFRISSFWLGVCFTMQG